MSTASLPEPLAEGDLSRTPFAHLLLYVRQHTLTGSLVVWDPSAGDDRPKQDRIRFEGGAPVRGRLLERASRLDRGMLPLFARDAGPYAFYEGVDLVGEGDGVRTGSVEIPALIAASLRGSSRDDVVDHVVGAFGDRALRLTRGADLAALGLLAEEMACLELLRAEPVSVARLGRISPLDERLVRRLVYLLALVKGVEPWDPESAPKRPARTPTPSRESKAAPKREDKREKPAAGPDGPPPPPDHLADKHRALWEEITQRVAAIESENYFDMLGVPRDAASEKIETAYYGLVKKWHPDRIPKEVVELRPFVERIFKYLTRAQEVLCDDERRGSYLATVQEGGGTPESEREMGQIIQAAMDFRKVEVLMRRREWNEALEILDGILAVSEDDDNYHATRAQILLGRAGGNPDAVQSEILVSVDRALQLNERNDRAHYTKGLIFKRAGNKSAALRHFEFAAEYNPKNIDAVREVRLANMRGGTSEAPAKDDQKAGGDSLFGKLFGKKK